MTDERGLTLVELLVVLAILGLLAGVAVMNAPPLRSSARTEAEVFAARLMAATDSAIVDGAPGAIVFDGERYRVERYYKGAWIPDDRNRRFAERAVNPRVAVSVNGTDASMANAPNPEKQSGESRRLTFDPIGGLDFFTVDFADAAERWIVVYEPDGSVKVRRDAAS